MAAAIIQVVAVVVNSGEVDFSSTKMSLDSTPGLPALRAAPPLAVLADRAGGALVGAACGDALGVPYEFVSPRVESTPHMIGGGHGPYAPGEWSDDTQLMVCVAEVSANGLDLTDEPVLDAIGQRYLKWFHDSATDVDSQTRIIFESVDAQALGGPFGSGREARKLRRSAIYFHRRTGRSAGNAVLPRMAVVGLTRLNDREWTAAAAREVTMLTHVDDYAGDASVLWAEAVRRACMDPAMGDDLWAERIHIEDGLDLLPTARRDEWAQILSDARAEAFAPPRDNTYVVQAVQAAVGALVQASRCEGIASAGVAGGSLVHALEAAVRIGGDTDTVAATVGALAGASCGAAAVPSRWLQAIHGWPGMRAVDLRDLGAATAVAGVLGEQGMQMVLHSNIDVDDLLFNSDSADTSCAL